MEQLGIQPSLLLAQVVNFAIIVVVLSKLLYKPILGMLEKRKLEIAQGLAITEKMREEEEKFNKRKEKMLSDARKEGHEIIEEARKQAKVEEKEILAAAREESSEVIEKGKAEVERMRAALSKNLEAESIKLAVTMAKRMLVKNLTSTDQHTILDSHMSQIEKLRTF